MFKKFLTIVFIPNGGDVTHTLRVSHGVIAVTLTVVGLMILGLFGFTGGYIGKVMEKPKTPFVTVTKVDTVFVPVEKPDKDVKLYDAQVRFYDFVLKLVIGIFSLIFIAGGVFLYRDRQQIREEIVGDAKRQVESYEKRVGDIGKALESLIDQANKIKKGLPDLKKLAQPDKKITDVLKESKREVEELKKTVMDRISELDAKLAQQKPIPEEMGTERQAVRLFNAGVEAYDSGRHEEAIEKWKEVINLKPDLAEAHYNLGLALGKKGKTEEEITEYREAIRYKPDFAEAHFHLGLQLGSQGRPDEEITEYREAIRHKPDYVEAHFNLGFAYVEQGKPEEGMVEYREAIRHKPDYIEAHYNLACLYSVLGRKEEALKSLQIAYEKGGNFWYLMKDDEEFNNLKDDTKFKELAEKVKARWEEMLKEKDKEK